uniref:Uncharacterized protein AlNc14C26G2559 n=1 Tax=Albugo laibachii Nc14 TaxID=890382 RepID=F0W6S3_9STRA|nr:conserved hypothetical protein [Albugo laibachii Nc14]|eukprot:CCA16818.1 conserved hypothetical protein [Albugo laibachii Nc14]
MQSGEPSPQVVIDAPYTLHMRVHTLEAFVNTRAGHFAYCKLYIGHKVMTNGSRVGVARLLMPNREDDLQKRYMRTFKTNSQAFKRQFVVWNQKFRIGVLDPEKEVMTFRIKSRKAMFRITIGACAFYLNQLLSTEGIDQWLPLSKGIKSTGQIRLQLRLLETKNIYLNENYLADCQTTILMSKTKESEGESSEDSNINRPGREDCCTKKDGNSACVEVENFDKQMEYEQHDWIHLSNLESNDLFDIKDALGERSRGSWDTVVVKETMRDSKLSSSGSNASTLSHFDDRTARYITSTMSSSAASSLWGRGRRSSNFDSITSIRGFMQMCGRRHHSKDNLLETQIEVVNQENELNDEQRAFRTAPNKVIDL